MRKTTPRHRSRDTHEALETERLRRRLLAAGVPLPTADVENIEAKPELTVEAIGKALAYDFRCSIEFALPVRITNWSYAWLEVGRFKLRVSWNLPNPTWLGDPRVCIPETKFYRLPHGREFRYDTVLNHRIGTRIGPRESWQGILLAWSMGRRIDGELLHGSEFPARISIIDQFGRRHVSAIELQADRSATMRRPLRLPTGRGLYDDAQDSERKLMLDRRSGACEPDTVSQVVARGDARVEK